MLSNLLPLTVMALILVSLVTAAVSSLRYHPQSGPVPITDLPALGICYMIDDVRRRPDGGIDVLRLTPLSISVIPEKRPPVLEDYSYTWGEDDE